MLTKQAVEFFKTQKALADALGIKQASVATWKSYPPDRRQIQIERLTEGKLKAEPECLARVLGMPLRRKSDRAGE